MSIQTSGRSLYDMVKNLDADGNAIKTAEVLQKACPMLQDAPVVAANNIFTHKVSIRTSLPKAEVKRLNQGVGGSFGSRDNREFGLKTYQSLPWIDKMEFKFAKDANEVRQSNMESICMIQQLTVLTISTVLHNTAKHWKANVLFLQVV